MPTGKQTVWTQEEDEMLQRLVQQHGTKKWALISKKIGTKAGKQCRRRWQNHLSINKNTSGWSPEEDQLLLDAHKRMGNRWTDIAKLCNGRTDNAVKNRFIAINKKRQNAKGKGKGKAGNSSKPPPTLPAGMGSSPVRRVQLKHGLSIQIPQGPFVRNASAATPSALNPISIRLPKESLTPQELQMVQHINALHSPLQFQIEDWPAHSTRSRQSSWTPTGGLHEAHDVISWIFAETPAANPLGKAPAGALGGVFQLPDIPESARAAAKHLLQKHLSTQDLPSPSGPNSVRRSPRLNPADCLTSPAFSPNEINMLLRTLDATPRGGTPGPRRARGGLRGGAGLATPRESPLSRMSPRFRQ